MVKSPQQTFLGRFTSIDISILKQGRSTSSGVVRRHLNILNKSMKKTESDQQTEKEDRKGDIKTGM